MKITLNRLTLENFKGVESFTLAADGRSCMVLGDNGVGKTTLMDAFLWLLFGKDSQGKADFAIKTLDREGREITGEQGAAVHVQEPSGPESKTQQAEQRDTRTMDERSDPLRDRVGRCCGHDAERQQQRERV